jgi:signal transduction histidine kinase
MLIFGFFAAGPLQFLVVLTSLPEWNGFAPDVWWPHPFANRATYGAVLVVISAFWAFLAVAMTWVGLQRLRSMKRMDQALALPVVVCYCAVGLVASFSCVFNPFPPPTQNAFYFAMSLVMFFIPIGLVIAASARTVRRFTLAAQLSKRLAKQVLTGDVVRNEFRKLLGDDSLELYYWSEPSRCYVDTDGHRADVDLDGRQGVTAYLTNAQSEPMAVVVGDAMLVDHVSMLDSFFAASAIAIENVQLQASVKAQLEQVRASRARIVEATLEERRRIERDLHDGVQQRLLALQLKVATFRGSGIDATRILLDELSTELSDTLRSLRELAHGIHPTELRQFGLRGAIEVVAERFPLEIDLQVADERFSALVESTLYFVTCEALANVVKHAEATRVTVSIDRVDDHVFLKVEDNGKGGAVIRPGHGLDGLSERLRSVGGSMALAPATHDGCSLTSKLPIKAGEGG